MLDSDCNECIEAGLKFCLNINDFTEGACCDPTIPDERDECQSSNYICATSSTITNPVLQNFVCPANKDKCPATKRD